MAKLTTEEFIAKAKAVHGDRYDYSKVEYVGQKAKVCILCKEHGEFLQPPYDHLSGHGCIKCHRKAMARRYSLGKEKFIEKANAVHRGFYDYSEVEYVNGHTKVKITCPIHGIFEQDPASHLQGHGCPFCADIENGKKKRKWTYESCREVAKGYKTRTAFQRGNPGAYVFARKKGLLEKFDWFDEIKKPNGYWTRERCEEESRKYQSKKEFVKGCSAAHHAAVVNGWLDDFKWLADKRFDIIKGKVDSVYVYIFEETKTAYVGRTLIRRQKKRDKEHIFNIEADNVARYAKKIHVPVPPMKIIETNLTLEEGQDREDYWRKWYEQQGYTMLNRIATGLKDYSWFAVLKREWDKETCLKEAQKYKTRGDFCKGCFGAYNKSLNEGWIDEFTWLRSRQTRPVGYWDNYEHCYEEAKKYKNRRAFMKGCSGAYTKAWKNGWLDDYTWFKEMKKPNGFWTQETCLEEAKKYSSKKEFKQHANGAYQFAYKEGWLDDYTWFKPLTGYWTYEACKAEAVKYQKRVEFKKGCPGAYSKSRINGWMDEFFPKK